ncbi:tRNA (guanosine(46)-N7)-methyltransferase TrmB [Alkalimarinus coralli]|uniref:tRNA (guanosine(46)-N7)-methyltransferase TrmB n=1 Tax=Alkalimarinus coralli TaxID=2935863 RepID=UPI00202AF9D3|nr:tRNA (guanosine(46)-N7)-methyltransferase TrmB [Alkalimarinus coralli]
MTDSETKRHHRPIRSFVIRGARMTLRQQKGWDQLWPEKGCSLDDGMLDYSELFGDHSQVVLEIGFGMGGSLAEMAGNSPDTGYIGVEVHRPGVGAILCTMKENSLDNIRLFCDDANEVLACCIPDGSLDRVQLYFPDPWHKARHHKRRLVQPDFAQKIRQKLKVGGIFHMATDWENYAEHMMEVMSAAEGYENISGEGQYTPRPDYRPTTKFEKRGERLGHGVWDLIFKRIG